VCRRAHRFGCDLTPEKRPDDGETLPGVVALVGGALRAAGWRSNCRNVLIAACRTASPEGQAVQESDDAERRRAADDQKRATLGENGEQTPRLQARTLK
jgi:hypothetical protein